MRQPDHWYARNFAKNDASTREHVRRTLIPRWREEIEENKKAIAHLRRIGRGESDPVLALILDEMQTIRSNIEVAEARLNDWENREKHPIPMILHCPQCAAQHIDAPDPKAGWNNPPHRSHLCNACGTLWRPANVPTTGVAAIGTRGRSDTWPFRTAGDPTAFDLHAHLVRQAEWSERTFGPGTRTQGVIHHIRKELREIEAAPGDLTEWIDVVLLALDGRGAAGPVQTRSYRHWPAKQAKNESRAWPDWRQAGPSRAIEHVRSEPASQ